MDENPATIPTGFAPLDFLVAMVMPSISEPIIEAWDSVAFEFAEKAKDRGLSGIYNLTDSEWFNKDKYGNYQHTLINNEILNKLLKGEIKTLKELNKLYENQLIKYNYNKSSFEYTILYYTVKEENTDYYKTYVDSIFIN